MNEGKKGEDMTKNVWTAKKTARRLLPLSALALALAATFNCTNEDNGKNKDAASQNDVGFTYQIEGGRDAKHEKFPWQVSIGRTALGDDAFDRHHCGGSLLKAYWVLTAAHCLDKDGGELENGMQLIDPEELRELRVVHGATDLRHTGRAAMRRVAEVYYHCDYIGKPWRNDGNDIALLRLSAPIESPTSYADLPTKIVVSSNARAVVSGYGKTRSRNNSPILRSAKVRIEDKRYCPYAHGKYTISSREICAGFLDGNACKGDSGGPLMVVENGKQVLAGVVSWTWKICGGTRKPFTVYARVSHYLDWIHKTMQGQWTKCEGEVRI